jgi:hypothetical protein
MTALRKLLNSLALAPLRTCRTLHHCCLCDKPIMFGEQYRDCGYRRRAHQTCFESWSKKEA